MNKLFRLKNIDKFQLDDPQRTIHHREIILGKPFLKNLYNEWYNTIKKEVDSLEPIIELGSGGGFLKDIIKNVKTSDVLELPTNDLTFSALDMPFENNSIGAFVMVDVFHHIPDINLFLNEASRTLKDGGKIVMIEPWNSFWGRFIYKNFHHEPFNIKGNWNLPSNGPMSDANGALPWIVFKRDINLFQKAFPNLTIKRITPHTPIRYLLSGGVSRRSLVPSWSFQFFTFFEKILTPLRSFTGMFVFIVIEKNDFNQVN